MNRSENFDKAMVDLTARRGANYGHPLDNFRRIELLHAVIDECPDPEVRHALKMVAVKIARLIQTPDHVDSVEDIAGYARTIAMIQDEREKRFGLKVSGLDRTEIVRGQMRGTALHAHDRVMDRARTEPRFLDIDGVELKAGDMVGAVHGHHRPGTILEFYRDEDSVPYAKIDGVGGAPLPYLRRLVGVEAAAAAAPVQEMLRTPVGDLPLNASTLRKLDRLVLASRAKPASKPRLVEASKGDQNFMRKHFGPSRKPARDSVRTSRPNAKKASKTARRAKR